MKKKLLKYGIPFLIGLAASALIMWGRGAFSAEKMTDVYKYISDGFFVISMLYIGFGLLLFAASEGILDIIGYGFKSLIYLFSPVKKDKAVGGYYEYKVKQAEKRKAVPYHIIIIGVIFLIPTIVFAILA